MNFIEVSTEPFQARVTYYCWYTHDKALQTPEAPNSLFNNFACYLVNVLRQVACEMNYVEVSIEPFRVPVTYVLLLLEMVSDEAPKSHRTKYVVPGWSPSAGTKSIVDSPERE